jgi:hypothetical protein
MLAKGNSLPFEFAAQTAEVAQHVDRRLRLRTCLGAERITGLKRDEARKLLDSRFKRVRDPSETPAPLARNCARPGGKGIDRGFYIAEVPRGRAEDVARRCVIS